MPELPEVETTIKGLKQAQPPILRAGFVDVWTDFPKMIKKPKSFKEFREKIKGKKIKTIWRRGKNIIFELTGGCPLLTYYLLIHQKLTGHLLLGAWNLESENWKPKIKGPLEEKINTFIHLLFTLDNGQMLALSDLRKFAKVELLNQEELEKELSSLGPEPLEKDFTFQKFKEVLPKKGKIKPVLMDQKVIAGIGNIYSDEILWRAKINPMKEISQLKEKELNKIYQTIRKILVRAIELRGESISDYRQISGEKGGFDIERKVYRRQGEKCFRCQTPIKRVKLGGRSAYYCPKCQQ